MIAKQAFGHWQEKVDGPDPGSICLVSRTTQCAITVGLWPTVSDFKTSDLVGIIPHSDGTKTLRTVKVHVTCPALISNLQKLKPNEIVRTVAALSLCRWIPLRLHFRVGSRTPRLTQDESTIRRTRLCYLQYNPEGRAIIWVPAAHHEEKTYI